MYFKINQVILVRSERDQPDSLELQEELCTTRSQEGNLNSSCTLFSARNCSETIKTTCIIDPEGCPFNYLNSKLKDFSQLNPDVPTVIDLGSDCSCTGNVNNCKCKEPGKQRRSRSAEPSNAHDTVPDGKKFADVLNQKKTKVTKVPSGSKSPKSEDSDKDSHKKDSEAWESEPFQDIDSEKGSFKPRSKVPHLNDGRRVPKTANIVRKKKNTAKTISADTFVGKTPALPGTSKLQQDKSLSDSKPVSAGKGNKVKSKRLKNSFSSSDEQESDLGAIKWKDRIGSVTPKDSFVVAKEREKRKLSIDSNSNVHLFQQSEREVIFPSKFTLKTGSFESIFSSKVSVENCAKNEQTFDKELLKRSATNESVDISNICVNSRKIVESIILEENQLERSNAIDPKGKLELPKKPASANIFNAKAVTPQKSKDANSVKHVVHKVKVPNKVKKSLSLKSNPFSIHERHKVREPTKRKDDTSSFRSKDTLPYKRPEVKKKVPRYNVKPHLSKASERKLEDNKPNKKNIASKLKREKSSEKRDICNEDTCARLNILLKKNSSEIAKNIKSKSSTSTSNFVSARRLHANPKKKTFTDNLAKKRKAVSKKISCRSFANPYKNKFNQIAPRKRRSDLRKEKFTQVNEKKSVGVQKIEVKPEYCQTCICTCQLLGNNAKKKFKHGRKLSRTLLDLDKTSDSTVSTVLSPKIKCWEHSKNNNCISNKTENIFKHNHPFSLRLGALAVESAEKINKRRSPHKSGREFTELQKFAIPQTRNIQIRHASGKRYKFDSSVQSRESEKNSDSSRSRKGSNSTSKTELKSENKEPSSKRYKFESAIKPREFERNSNNLRYKKGISTSKSELRGESKEASYRKYKFEPPIKAREAERNYSLRSKKGERSPSKSELKGEKGASFKKYKFETSPKSREPSCSVKKNLRCRKGEKSSSSKSDLKTNLELCKCCSSDSNRTNRSAKSLVKLLKNKAQDLTLKSSEDLSERSCCRKSAGGSKTSVSDTSGSKGSTRSKKSTDTLRKEVNGRKRSNDEKKSNKNPGKHLNFSDDTSESPRKRNKNRRGKKVPKDSLERIVHKEEDIRRYKALRDRTLRDGQDRENIRSAPCSLNYIDSTQQTSQASASSNNRKESSNIADQKRAKRVFLVSPGTQERSKRKKAGEPVAYKLAKSNISNSTLYCRVNNSPLNLEESFHKDFYRPTWNAILRCSTKFPESCKKTGFVHFSDSVSDPNISRRIFSPTIESISNNERYRSKPLLSQKVIKLLRKYEKGLSRKSALKLHVSGYCRCDSDCECRCEDWSSSSSNNVEEEMNNRYVYPAWTPPEPGPGLKNYHSRISNFIYSNNSSCPCSETKFPQAEPMADKNSVKFCEDCSVRDVKKEMCCNVEPYSIRKSSKIKAGSIVAQESESNDLKGQKKVYFDDAFDKPPSPSTRPQNQRLSFLDDPPYCNMENFLSDVNFKKMKLLYRIRNESNNSTTKEMAKKTNDTEHYCRYSLPRWVNKDRDDR